MTTTVQPYTNQIEQYYFLKLKSKTVSQNIAKKHLFA